MLVWISVCVSTITRTDLAFWAIDSPAFLWISLWIAVDSFRSSSRFLTVPCADATANISVPKLRRSTSSPCFSLTNSMAELITVVFPTPGTPVTITVFLDSLMMRKLLLSQGTGRCSHCGFYICFYADFHSRRCTVSQIYLALRVLSKRLT